MWLVSAVDLPVPVETAGISQLLPADLALDGWLTIGPNLPGSTFIKMFKFLPESCRMLRLPDAPHGMFVCQLVSVEEGGLAPR